MLGEQRGSEMPQRHARACWIAAKGRAELRDEVLPEPAPDDLLIETRYSAISRGTEALVFEHAVPPSEYERMRAPFQSGMLPGPVKYGYASVGRVAQGRPASAKAFLGASSTS